MSIQHNLKFAADENGLIVDGDPDEVAFFFVTWQAASPAAQDLFLAVIREQQRKLA